MTIPHSSESTLEQILKRRIAEHGPLRVSDYMEAALYHPDFGYYVKAKPIGAEGDFITAPEISQMFGELIGLWCLQAWRDMGRPARFRWIELGPGRGNLMQDALRATGQDPQFTAAAKICLVEKNEHLQARQAEALNRFDNIQWYSGLNEIPDDPSIVIANEFFDCLPIDQFIFRNQAWFQRKVGLDSSGALAFETDTEPVAADTVAHAPPGADDGDIIELCPPASAVIKTLTAKLLRFAGRALIIDYGYQGPAIGDTLQSIALHKFADVLQNPGQVDITAHVDFAALAKDAEDQGLVAHGPIEQGAFLNALGLPLRADALKAHATPAQAAAITQAAHRLVDPHQMGELFKVLSLSSPGLTAPPGFAADESARH